MIRGNLPDQTGGPESPGAPTQDANDVARQIGGDPSPSAVSGVFSPAVIEDIQIKAELARYRIRGFGALRERTWATFDDLTFVPAGTDANSARRIPRVVFFTDRPGHPIRRQTARPRDSAHGDWHELWGPLAPGENGPCPCFANGGNVVYDGRRRDARRRADRVAAFDL